MTRELLEALVWKHTSKDFKGTIDGVRHVLHLCKHGTCSVPLSSLTELQLRDKLPSKIRERNFGPDPMTPQDRAFYYHRLACELGHTPLKQGKLYECPRCGDSGRLDDYYGLSKLVAIGPIFTDRCGS